MTHLDPYGEPGQRGWDQQDGYPGWEWEDASRRREGRDAGAGTPVRARHAGAAPDTYAWPVSYRSTPFPDGQSQPQFGGAHPRPDRGYSAPQPTYQEQGFDPRYAQPQYEAPYPQPDHPGYPYPAGGPYQGETDPVADAATATLPVVDPAPEPAAGPGRHVGRRRAGGSGRAGRNLPAAIGVGLVLAACIVVPLFVFRPAFFAVVAAAVAVGSWELGRAVAVRGARPPLVPLIAGGLLMTGLAWRAGPDGLSLGLLVTVLATLVWRLADGPAGYQRDLAASALIAVYVPFLAGFAVLLAVPPDGDWRVLVTLAAVVLSDTGGYVVGVFFGKRPMAPSVSPKKSWEGFGGSVGSAAIGSALLLDLALDVEPWWGALFGLAVSVAAVLGDLCESMIKRDLGVKDMSDLLPGHGGLMDRLDSVLFAVPTAYLLLSIFGPPV